MSDPSWDPRRAQRTSVLYVLLGIVVGVAATLAVVAVVDGDDSGAGETASSSRRTDRDDAPPTTSTSVSLEKLDEDARELVALADKGRTREFHSRYTTSEAVSGSGQPFTVSLELWNKPPRVRRDVSIDSQGQVVESADIQGDKLVRCGKASATADWQCVTPPPGTPSEPGGVAFGLAPGALSGRPVTVTDETVANQPARCFKADLGTGSPEELCLSADGIPLRVTSGAAVLELEKLELSVEDGVFEPPARPIGA